jgi:hypothetical protein
MTLSDTQVLLLCCVYGVTVRSFYIVYLFVISVLYAGIWFIVLVAINFENQVLEYIKCILWMPWRLQATKDVLGCDKLR